MTPAAEAVVYEGEVLEVHDSNVLHESEVLVGLTLWLGVAAGRLGSSSAETPQDDLE